MSERWYWRHSWLCEALFVLLIWTVIVIVAATL